MICLIKHFDEYDKLLGNFIRCVRFYLFAYVCAYQSNI